MEKQAIPRQHQLTEDIFIKEYLEPQRPVILTGMIDDWRALTSWQDVNHLKEVAGTAKVPFLTSFKSDGSEEDMGDTPFSECLDYIFSDDEEKTYYIHEAPIALQCPHLAEDFHIVFPQISHDVLPLMFWMGSGYRVGNVHWDYSHNFLCQVSGKKTVHLFSPFDSLWLYPPNPHEDRPHYSPIDSYAEVDLNTYPLFKNTTCWEGSIEPGEVLFMPSMWWHQVCSEGRSMAISHFWHSPGMWDDHRRLHRYVEHLADDARDATLETLETIVAPRLQGLLSAFFIRLVASEGQKDEALRLTGQLLPNEWKPIVEQYLEV